MINPIHFLQQLKANGISFFTGVPDSLMQSFLLQLEEEKDHMPASSEGAAVAMATGYHLATGNTGLVYLQNSGLGNAINPISSLAAKEVYGIPMLLMIGWRGQPGKKDEPQHLLMGSITPGLLELIGIPYFIFSIKSSDNWKNNLKIAVDKTLASSQPVAIIIEDDFFEPSSPLIQNDYPLSSEQVLDHLYPLLDPNTVVIATTGKLGRLFYALNSNHHNRVQKFFMNVGAMGHASAIAASFSMYSKEKVVLLDGDGSLLMHMGSLAVTGSLLPANLHYILFNNGAHQSVGGQKTAGFKVDFCKIAIGCGFASSICIESATQLQEWMPFIAGQFTEVRINTKMPAILPRPAESFKEAKIQFQKESRHL